jgi:hypothetical protein
MTPDRNNSDDQPEERRRDPLDPRLVRRPPSSAISVAAAVSGWLGCALLLVGLLWWAAAGAFIWQVIASLGVGVLGLAFWAAVNRKGISQAVRRRQFQTGLNSTVFSVFVVGILVLLNVVSYRHSTSKDMTAAKLHSLSEQTVVTVKKLDADVQLLVFIDPADVATSVGDVMMQRCREYERLSPHIKLEVKDPYLEQELVRKYNVLTPQASGDLAPASVVVVSGDRHDTVTGGQEAGITNAIISMTTQEKPKVYVLAGDGEYPLQGDGQDDLSNLKRVLETQQYVVEPLLLGKMAKPAVPADCKVLVIAGPTHPLAKPHLDAIKKYLDANGKALIALSCGILEPGGAVSQAPDLKELLQPHGVEPMRGMVIDLLSQAEDKRIPAISTFANHPIVQGLQLVALPESCALQVTEAPPPPSYPGAPPPPASGAKALFSSSAQASWLETSLVGGKANPAGKTRGPLALAAAVDEGAAPPPTPGMPPEEQPTSEGAATRLVVFGSAAFLANRYSSGPLWGNQDMAVKSIAWLAARENLVSIPPKTETPRFLTMKRSQKWLVTAICLFGIPGCIILSGALAWFVRRRG